MRLIPLAAILAVLAGTILAGCGEAAPPPHLGVPGGDADRGKLHIARYGCAACHRIPGFGASGQVGPPLDDFAVRGYIGGVLPNQPQNLVAWIVDPPAHAPGTAMPNLGVSREEARDIAAYLHTPGRRAAKVFPPPRTPPVDMEAGEAERARAEARLNGYGWAEGQPGLARIPIDRAMELLESRGWDGIDRDPP